MKPPSLFFDREDVATMRASCGKGYRKMFLERMVHAAEACLNPQSPHYLDYKEQKREMWWTRVGIFTVTPSLIALSAASIFTAREDFGRAAVEAMLTIIRDGISDRQANAWGNETQGWRHGNFHDKGKFSQAMALAYDFCWEYFSPSERGEFALFAKESIGIARKSWSQDWNFISSNRGIRGILAGFWYRVALMNEIPLHELDPGLPNFDEEIRAIEYFFNTTLDCDGAPYEGPGYAAAIPFVAAAAYILHRKGQPNLLTNLSYQRAQDYFLYELVPSEGRLNNLNDADKWDVYSIAGHFPLIGTPAGALIPWLAEKIDLASGVKGEGRYSRWLSSKEPCILDIRTENLLYFLLWWKCDDSIMSPQALGYPTAKHFRDRGLVSMRTGWMPTDMLVSHFAGTARLRCHRQADANHIAWYAGNDDVLIDSGYGAVFSAKSTEKMDRWFGKTEAHNTILINGQGQRGEFGREGWPVSSILDFESHEDYATSLGDASGCYGFDHTIVKFLRRVVLVKKPFQVLIVVDSVIVDGEEFTADFLWHTAAENGVETTPQGWKIHTPHQTIGFLQATPEDRIIQSEEYNGHKRIKMSTKGREISSVVIAIPSPKSYPVQITAETKCLDSGDYEIRLNSANISIKVIAPARLVGVERRPARVKIEAL